MTPRRTIEIVGVVLRLLLANLDLAYYLLPRWLRGGYRSPWDHR